MTRPRAAARARAPPGSGRGSRRRSGLPTARRTVPAGPCRSSRSARSAGPAAPRWPSPGSGRRTRWRPAAGRRAGGPPARPAAPPPRPAGCRSGPGSGPRRSTGSARAATTPAGSTARGNAAPRRALPHHPSPHHLASLEPGSLSATPRAAGTARTAGPRPHRLRQRNLRAVLPEPFQRVVDALLGVLNVDDQVEVVEQDPAPFALALPAHRPGTGLAQPLLDLIYDGPHLAVVGGRAQQKHVGDDELLTHVVRDDVGGELLGCGLGRDPGKLDGPGCSGHVCSSFSSGMPFPRPLPPWHLRGRGSHSE